MRVLLISHTCQSRREGQPRAEMLGRLPGIELTVLAPDRFRMADATSAAEPPEDGASFRFEVGRARLPWAGPAQCYLHHYAGLRRIFERVRPELIDVWEEPWGLVSAQVVRLRNRFCPGVPIVSETEQNLDKRLPFPFESMRRYTLRNVQHVVGRNAAALELVRRRGYAGPASVVPNAVDEALFRPLDRERCRRELGVAGTVVAYVGRLVEQKGIDEIVEAIRQLPPDVQLLVAGDGPMMPTLRAAAEQMPGRVKLLGAVPLARLPEVMNAADVLLLPSRSTHRWTEQFGRVIIEAHACGTPVIGSDSGAIPDVVGAGGLIVPERDPGALAGAIRRLRDDPQSARRMGAAGRERTLRLFTWRAVAQRMADIYEAVLHGPTPPAERSRSAAPPAMSRRVDVYDEPTAATAATEVCR